MSVLRGDGNWRAVLAPAAALAAAVAYPTFAGGGFSDSSRAVFVALAGVALVIAAAGLGLGRGAEAMRAAARKPIAISLAALGLFSVLSAAWTITSASVAIRWGLVILGYGAIVVTSAQVATRTGPRVLAIGLLVLAVAEAILGLQAVVRHALPDAEYLSGRWRPGGTFEYQPALALLEVSALPVVVWLAGRTGRRRAASLPLALACAALLGFSLGLSGTRLEPALGGLLLLVLIARPPSGLARGSAALVAALATVAFVVALQTGGGTSPRRLDHRAAHRLETAHGATAARPPRPAAHSDLLHGRGHEWLAALETWEDRPLLGAGAGSYLAASLRHQGQSVSLYAHDLPLEAAAELGVLGFLLVLGIYAGGIRTLARARAAPEALLLLGPMCAFFLISNLLDWTWHLAGMGAIWAAATGVLLAAAPPRPRRRLPGKIGAVHPPQSSPPGPGARTMKPTTEGQSTDARSA